MEQLKSIRQCLVTQVQSQMGDLKKTDTKELSEAIDMIKDLEEAMYYCAITKAMEENKEKKEEVPSMMYYGGRRMYYDDGRQGQSMSNGGNSSSSSGSNYYTPYMEYAPYMMQDEDWRNSRLNGRSQYSRRMYMEGAHSDSSMKELEHYIKDLGDDLTDMIKGSSQEEKQVLSTKLQQLATKINNNVK